MVKYKTTAEALKIIANKEQIRNMGVIAHVDHGKCISGESLIPLSNGEIVSIKELYSRLGENKEKVELKEGLKVDSLDVSSLRMKDLNSSAIWKLKTDQLVKITLKNGYEILVTPEHPFYSLSPLGLLKALRADEINPGEYIAVPNILKSLGTNLDDVKSLIIKKLSQKEYYLVYVSKALAEKILLKFKEIGYKELYSKIQGTISLKGFVSGAKKGRFRLKDLISLTDTFNINYTEVYDHIISLMYRSSNKRFGRQSKKIKLPKTSEEFKLMLYGLGLLFGDGTNRASLTSSNPAIIHAYKKMMKICFNLETKMVKGKTTFRIDHHGGYTLMMFLKDVFSYPLKNKSHNLRLPTLVTLMHNEFVLEFLRGLYDTDGTVDMNGVSLTLASKELVRELSLTLLRFKVIPSIYNRGPYKILTISSNNLINFKEKIGFKVREKAQKLEKLVKVSTSSRISDIVPIKPEEIKTLRIVLGLSGTIKEIPYYKKYEEGKVRITWLIFNKILNVFERSYENKKDLADKYKLLELIKEAKLNALNHSLRLTISKIKGILASLKADRLIIKKREGYKVTRFGIKILEIWRALLKEDSPESKNVRMLLEQWKKLAKGDIRFIQVKSKEFIKGDFDVYDLTVPNTHTFVANGIIVHNTTMSDSLLAACGMISPAVAGQVLALDFMDLEQQRQMTIKAANVTLYYEYEGKPYVINMIDTPGHIDFTGKVTRSLRAIDGAVVVVDAVEGVMTQTETVTSQALEERVRPVLYINKIDRLVKELKLTPAKMQSWLANIVAEFNNLISLYAEPEFKEKWKVRIEDSSVAFGSAKDKWGFNFEMAKRKGIRFSDIYNAYNTGDIKFLTENIPLHEAVLSMVIKHHPPPHVAQRYRIPKIWRGDLDSSIGKAMLECDEEGPMVMMVTNVVVDPQAGIVAVGRLFSGKVRDGDIIYLVGARREERVQSVTMFMGPYREIVGELPSGNIPALLGLEHARAGETLSQTKDMIPFESVRYVSEPVVTISVEPKHPKDLPKLVDALRNMSIEDPNLVIKINEETGEMLMSGMGVLHLEIATTLLQEKGLEIITSKPLINYRETIRGTAGPVMAKSPNRHNQVFIRAEPLSEKVVSMILTGEINEIMERKAVAKILREQGWNADEARNVVSIDERGNLFVDGTKGVQFLQESLDSLRAGFIDVMRNGPLAYEYCRGIKIVLHHFVPHEDPAHRTYAQLMPAARRAILGAMLLANPVLLEPILEIEVKCPTELIGTVASVISSKRGKIINIEQKEFLSLIKGEIPASETFDLSEVMRGATAGKALWSTHFKLWAPLPSSMQSEIINQIRKRKGLPPEVPRPYEFLDKE